LPNVTLDGAIPASSRTDPVFDSVGESEQADKLTTPAIAAATTAPRTKRPILP
jgi:hypothetical protein